MGDLPNGIWNQKMNSSEMVEVLGLSDRIVVMKEGRVTAVLNTAHTSQEQILRSALGSANGEVNHGK